MSIVKFSEVAHRAYTREDRFNTEKIYYVGGEHIDSCELYVTKKGVIKGSTIGPMFYCGFTAGQILFVTRNPHLKKCSIADFDGICSEKTFVIETKDESILTQEYLAIIMQSDDFWNYCEENKSGGVNYFLNWSTLADYEFELPPIKQQLEIAQKVMSAYRLKQSYKKLLDATREMVKSQFIEMFKEKGYPLRMLKSFADVSTGGTPSKANLEYWNGDKPWVSAEDMKNKYVYDTCEKVTEAGYATCKIIPVDTLMYVCRGSIGVMAINKIECATNQSICRAKCHDNVCNVEFLYHALMYQKDNIKKMGTGTSFKSLNQTSFSELKIELPPYNEQMKFVSIAQQADKSEFVGCKSQFIEMFGNQNTNDKGWTESLVKDEFKLSMGKTPARNNPECWDNGTHKWVSISDMSSYTRYTGDTSEYITDYAIADSGIKAVPKGTIIMSFKLSIGRTAITSEDLYTNEAIMAFAGFDEKKFNIDFLHFLIANKNWLLGAKQAVKGQTLNKESIGNAKIIIPPIEAQEEFASIYNQADKSEFVGCKSQFIEMFGNPVTNTKGWKTAKIKDVAPEMPSKEQLSGKIWLLNLDMIESNTGRIIEKVYEDVENALSVQSFDEGNVLFSKLRPYLNKVVIPDEPGMATTELVPLRPEPSKLHKVFLSHLLRGNQFVNYANDIAGGTKMPRMPLTELRNFDCILPPMDKQLEFVFIAEQVDKSEFELRKSIDAIDQVIKSLINN